MRVMVRRPSELWAAETSLSAAATPFRLLLALIAARSWIFLAMLSFMLFRPPGLDSFPFDRIAFAILCLSIAWHVTFTKEQLLFHRLVTRPMLALVLLSSCTVLCHGYSAESWSMFAAKWLVPFIAFQIAPAVFHDQSARQAFEIFALFVLAYLCFVSISFLIGATWAIVPGYILDQNLGIHADRARGPFLQAVANGMTLNMLGLLAVDSYRRGRLRGISAGILLGSLPLAILATRTRAVWLSFAGSALLLMFSKSPKLHRLRVWITVTAVISVVSIAFLYQSSIADRLEDRSPVAFRMAMYEAGWQMFLEKPLAGWGMNAMRDELSLRISEFHQEAFYFHNTYLEVLVEHGLLGLALYAWMAIDLFRIGRRRLRLTWRQFPDQGFRGVWPWMLAVYFVNATFVGMNYQFVNVMLFTIAGLLAAQNRVEDGIPVAH